MLRRIAVIQYDASGAVLQASTAFISDGAQSTGDMRDAIDQQLACHWLVTAACCDVIVERRGALFRLDKAKWERDRLARAA